MVRQGKDGNNSLENISEEELAVLIDKAKLPEELVESEYCIFRVPQNVRQVKEAAYTPRAISIGPYHNGDKKLKLMEPLKLRYLKSFLKRTELELENCISKLKEWEPSIRNCYEEIILLDSDAFLKMILIDAGFVIELFLRNYDLENWVRSDPVLQKPLFRVNIIEDLCLLENQLPFFVLEDLFALVPADVAGNFRTFRDHAFKFFGHYNMHNLRPDDVTNVRHFIDLVRIFYLPPHARLPKISEEPQMLRLLYSAHELVEAGLKFKADKSKKCEFQYERGVLTMSPFTVTGESEVLIRNMVAFEQGYCLFEAYITEYWKILDFLIDTDKDVEILVHKGIITNLLGDNNEVATMINHLFSNLIPPPMNSENLRIWKQLNEFYNWPVNKWKAVMIRDYCNTPVKIATSIAAIVLLILTAIQTVGTLITLAK